MFTKEDIIEIKKLITPANIMAFLEELSALPKFSNKNVIISRTICHDGSSHKLYYYCDTYTFHCYTNCGTFDIFELVIKTRKIQEDEDWEMFKAIIWVADFLGIAPKLKEFDDLPYKNKVMFTCKPYPEFKSVFYFEEFAGQDEVGVLTNFKEGFWRRRWIDKFDYVSFLNKNVILK